MSFALECCKIETRRRVLFRSAAGLTPALDPLWGWIGRKWVFRPHFRQNSGYELLFVKRILGRKWGYIRSKSILIIQKKTPGPAGSNGGTPVSIRLIPEGFMAKIHFTKNRKNRKFSENRKIQPHSLFPQ